jgi:glycosyltransferase involved in cell wall biosynthesis
MTPLRIAMVGTRGVPATFGGIEHHVEQLGSRMAARGHEVVVYCRPNYVPEGITEHRGMTLKSTPTVPTMHLDAFVHSGLSAAATVGSGLSGRGYDIVHFHALGPGLFTPLPRFLSRAAVVQTIHALDDQRAKWGGGAQKVLRLGGWLSARTPHEVITVSRWLREHYRDVHGRAVTYVPNGRPVGTQRAPREITERFGLRGDDYVLFVGRLVPEKDPLLLIRAFRQVDTDRQLIIAGGTSFTDAYTRELESEAAADPRVQLVGYVYGETLQELYSNAAVFVQPSLLEGLPLTLLEAATYGRAIVASAISPHLEVISHDAPGHRIFPPGDLEALAAALRDELATPADERARGAAALSRRVAAEYDWDDATDRTLQVYEDALAARGRLARARFADQPI